MKKNKEAGNTQNTTVKNKIKNSITLLSLLSVLGIGGYMYKSKDKDLGETTTVEKNKYFSLQDLNILTKSINSENKKNVKFEGQLPFGISDRDKTVLSQIAGDYDVVIKNAIDSTNQKREISEHKDILSIYIPKIDTSRVRVDLEKTKKYIIDENSTGEKIIEALDLGDESKTIKAIEELESTWPEIIKSESIKDFYKNEKIFEQDAINKICHFYETAYSGEIRKKTIDIKIYYNGELRLLKSIKQNNIIK